MSPTVQRLVLHRKEPMCHEIQSAPLAPLGASEILLRVDKFGLTSNNVTYAALGRALHYFEFFPVSAEWSALPVWGMATVIESTAPDVATGARVYGYFPAATHATLAVSGTTPTGFRTKRNLPSQFGFYHQYELASQDPLYRADREDMMVVMRPLFLTGVLLADYLAASEFMGAATVLVSSAASKTSFGMACALKQGPAPKLVGLASQASGPLALRMGVYDAVLTYDQIDDLPPSEPVVYVDVAGNPALRERLAARLGRALKLVLAVGVTHWKDGTYGGSKRDVAPTQAFFAPGWAARRAAELGKAYFVKLGSAWQAQMAEADRHFQVMHKQGEAALTDSFVALLEGRAAPEEAWVHSL